MEDNAAFRVRQKIQENIAKKQRSVINVIVAGNRTALEGTSFN